MSYPPQSHRPTSAEVSELPLLRRADGHPARRRVVALIIVEVLRVAVGFGGRYPGVAALGHGFDVDAALGHGLPVGRREPRVGHDVLHAVLQAAEPLGAVLLEQRKDEALGLAGERRRELGLLLEDPLQRLLRPPVRLNATTTRPLREPSCSTAQLEGSKGLGRHLVEGGQAREHLVD